jgi:serpin B
MARFNYGNCAYSMTVLLPDADHTLDECLEALTAENWKKWDKDWTVRTLIVKMPRFEIEYNKDLVDDMKALGINDAFNPMYADFSNMSDNALLLSLLKQYTRLKVDEEGTEAAAVTVSGMISAGPPPSTGPVPFHLNRPFVFTISETSTGTILFMGKVTEF